MASDSSILSREHHAAGGGIWPSPEGSDIRLPGGAASAAAGGGGGGDAIHGLDEQQAHKEGIHGSSFPKGLLEEDEWYDSSLIEEMKDLSYPPHSHSQSHSKPESVGCFSQLDASAHAAHPFVGRSSNNSSSSAAALSFHHQERRSFSSFLDAPVPLDESSGMISAGFLSDFSAGLLPPHPPPPPPPVVLRNGFSAANGHQQQHRQLFNVSLGSSSQQQQQNGGMFSPHTGFLADSLGNLGSSPMLDFSPGFFAPGGFNSSNATSNSGGNFGNFSGIGSSLSIGMMPKNNGGGVGVYGECFGGEGLSSKEASFKANCKSQHTGSGQSSPSTIIKSPAFGSADSSLELGDEPAGATTTSPKRKNQKEKKSPAASASAEDVALQAGGNGASAVDLDLREDEEMEDGSGLLCENDEAMGGHQKGPGGKGNRKGLPAKNLMAERRRRKKLNDRLYMLRSVVPKITKMDRASILGDAIEYLKELLQRINDLHTELEGPADAPMPLSPSPSPSLGGMQQPPPPLPPAMIPQTYPPCVKEECGGGAAPAATMLAGPPEMQPAKVDVRTRDGKTINIHMFCSKRPGLLLSTMRALDGLGLDVQQAVISCFNGFVLDVFRAEQFRDEIAAEEIKAVLLQTAACHDTIVPT